jgi:hypothetical protein
MFEKWPFGIRATLHRSLHCYELVLAKVRKEEPLTAMLPTRDIAKGVGF